MITCGTCGRENEDHYKFCLGCGGNLDAQRAGQGADPAPDFCPSCGSEISGGQRFCGSCGFKVEGTDDSVGVSGNSPAATTSGGSKEKIEAASAGAAAAPGAGGALIMVNPDGSPGDTFPLEQGVNVVGRDSSAEVLSRDPFLSPKHATFTVNGERVNVRDEDSLNGVYYRITEITEIQHGEFIRVGQEVLRFQLLDLADSEVAPNADGTIVAGSNPAGAWGKLERISAPDQASFTFLLRGAEVVIGRERGDILFRDDGYVSGKHARVFQDSGRYFVEDLKSSNGTFVRIRGERELASGALILIGQQPFRIQLA